MEFSVCGFIVFGEYNIVILGTNSGALFVFLFAFLMYFKSSRSSRSGLLLGQKKWVREWNVTTTLGKRLGGRAEVITDDFEEECF